MHTVDELLSSSTVPMAQGKDAQLPLEPTGTYNPGSVQSTHGVEALLSMSEEPSAHWKGVQLPVCPCGTNAPAGHHVHAVEGLKSSSMVPLRHNRELQGPNRRAMLRSVPALHVPHTVLEFESLSIVPMGQGKLRHTPVELAGT